MLQVGFTFATFLLFSSPASQLATELTRLRSEVDDVTRSIEQQSDETRQRLRRLRTQETDLSLDLQRERGRLEQSRALMAQRRERIDQAGRDNQDLLPAVRAALAALRNQVATDLPFRKADRLRAVDELDSAIKEGLLTPAKALSRYWALAEDEIRLGREKSMHKQTIDLEGAKVLADVIHLGRVRLFFRSPDNRYGEAIKKAG
ncbi:MAG: DUF3450 family protein, partial [Myxococcota bacterium]|nr:DUF3450 family protein [Myxococcota bacterium]